MLKVMDSFQEQVLFVGEVTDDIDLNEPPATGEEYIKRVILEARKCQDVVVKPIDETKLKQNAKIEISGEPSNTPGYLIPSQDWQNLQVKDFSNIRLYLAEVRSKKSLLSQMTRNLPFDLPNTEDQKSWLRICTEKEGQLSPKLNLVLSLNQPTVERVLEFLINYVKNHNSICHNLGRWIYALLAALELPLNPDTCSCLRSLARSCHKLRINLNSVESPEITIYNLFICLIARYFRQLDLADG